jgi:two-component system response regulator GlrR
MRGTLAAAEVSRKTSGVFSSEEKTPDVVPAGRGGSCLTTHSPAMRKVAALIEAVAPSDCAVLITGETGTGKERVARAIHARSRRARKRLFALHCAAIPPTLLERELFGHERGAFTGADQRRMGAFEAADGSTFLLDEIGELEPALQAKLLRVLQEKQFLSLGSTEPIQVDVRIVATTNRNLRAEVERKGFRADLFYRLNTVEIHLPPLCERREDILALCREFLAEAEAAGGPPRQLSVAAARLLLSHRWPGNVRELQSAIERACLLCDGPAIEPQHLPPEILGSAAQRPAECAPPRATVGLPDRARHGWEDPTVAREPEPPWPTFGPAPAVPDFREARRQFEREYLLRLLALSRGNITAAARTAGLSWKHFHNKMRELHLRADAWTTLAPSPSPAR